MNKIKHTLQYCCVTETLFEFLLAVKSFKAVCNLDWIRPLRLRVDNSGPDVPWLAVEAETLPASLRV